MVFTNRLYKVTVNVHTSRERYGEVTLTDEELGTLAQNAEEPGLYPITFKSDYDEDDPLSRIPQFW